MKVANRPRAGKRGTIPWLVLGCVMATGAGAIAQTPQAGHITYTKNTTFKLPVSMDDKIRAGLKEVCLYVKVGAGDWVRHETGEPGIKHFLYRVQRDGGYCFSLATVDKAGRMTPADVGQEPPGLRVVVDTQAPTIAVQPWTSPEGELCIRCQVQDANPDPQSFKALCQTKLGEKRLDPYPDQPLVFKMPPPDAQAQSVRVLVSDLAKNVGSKEINVKEFALAALPRMFGDLAPKNPPPQAPQTGLGAAPKQLINTTHASVDYRIDQIGPSGVGKVEIYLTGDAGLTWQRLGEDPDRRSPAEIDLPGEGLFGIRLVVTNGNGFGSKPPSRGDGPTCWIEVNSTLDITEPRANVVGVTGMGARVTAPGGN